jgi:hypothetical protein
VERVQRSARRSISIAGDVGHALDHRPPFDAETAGEQVAEVRLVEVAAGQRVVEQRPAVEGALYQRVCFGPTRALKFSLPAMSRPSSASETGSSWQMRTR